jgi:hypothetical protein
LPVVTTDGDEVIASIVLILFQAAQDGGNSSGKNPTSGDGTAGMGHPAFAGVWICGINVAMRWMDWNGVHHCYRIDPIDWFVQVRPPSGGLLNGAVSQW